MKHTLTFIGSFIFAIATVNAQNNDAENEKKIKLLEHLDAAVTVGTTGIGVDLAMPIGDVVQLRTGFTYMPRFNQTMHFEIQVGDGSDTEEEQQTKFERLSGLLKEYTGMTVDRKIDMIGQPTMQNFKFLVDVFPFRNKHWHITGGFYWGPSRVAKAVNSLEDATSLVSVAMYNSLYERILNSYENDEPYMTLGSSDLYATEDLYNRFVSYGRMGVHLGNYKGTNTSYLIEPDENNTVSATVKVNNFKPYLGFGYGGALIKDDDRYQISFDCGVMFWGGAPKIITHDGTDLVNDVENILGKVGDYVSVIKTFKVYPVLSLRISRRIF